jgi:hypothetical protein
VVVRLRHELCCCCHNGVQGQQRTLGTHSGSSSVTEASGCRYGCVQQDAAPAVTAGLTPCCAVLCCAALCCAVGKVSLAMYKEADGIEAYVYEDKIEDADAGGSVLH